AIAAANLVSSSEIDPVRLSVTPIVEGDAPSTGSITARERSDESCRTPRSPAKTPAVVVGDPAEAPLEIDDLERIEERIVSTPAMRFFAAVVAVELLGAIVSLTSTWAAVTVAVTPGSTSVNTFDDAVICCTADVPGHSVMA